MHASQIYCLYTYIHLESDIIIKRTVIYSIEEKSRKPRTYRHRMGFTAIILKIKKKKPVQDELITFTK